MVWISLVAAVARTSLLSFRHDRPAIFLSLILPITFFSVFAWLFGATSNDAPQRSIDLVVVDLDRSDVSRRLIEGLEGEESFNLLLDEEEGRAHSRASAQKAVRAGIAPVALIVPPGFQQKFDSIAAGGKPSLELLYDSADPVAPRLTEGVVQKVLVTAMPEKSAEAGMTLVRGWVGGFTPQQEKNAAVSLETVREMSQMGPTSQSFVRIATVDVLGTEKTNPLIAFYAAGFGVLFLLFTSANAGGALLDEAESGALVRVLSTQVTMTQLLAGKMLFLTIVGLMQLGAMFLWGQLVFGLELLAHVDGFLVVGLATSMAVSSFGLLLAAISRTRAQLNALSTLLILIISGIGGSMFPRYWMPDSVQRMSLVFFNSWALEGFLKVFWRESGVASVMTEIGVLLIWAALFFAFARLLARRWEAS